MKKYMQKMFSKRYFRSEQNKYTTDPGQLNLSQQYENNCWTKMMFEQKLVISKIWAKNTKNRKKWGFSLIWGAKNLKS